MRYPQAINQPQPANWQGSRNTTGCFSSAIPEARRKQLKLSSLFGALLGRPADPENGQEEEIEQQSPPVLETSRSRRQCWRGQRRNKWWNGPLHRWSHGSRHLRPPRAVSGVTLCVAFPKSCSARTIINNRSLPVSLWIHIFQLLLKLARVVGPK